MSVLATSLPSIPVTQSNKYKAESAFWFLCQALAESRSLGACSWIVLVGCTCSV